jgi:transcriptional antiterminator RfaH
VVVRTKPRQERRAVHHLCQRQVTPYCPMFLQPPWHLRAPRGPVPLFPGYIFVSFDPSQQMSAVRYCPGVLAPVTFGGDLATVDQGLVDAVRAREGSRGYAVPIEQETGIPEGAAVRIMSGPFAGFEGVFSGSLRGGERARVLLDLLRGRRSIEVDSHVLALAGA